MFEPILTRNIGVADSEKIATYLARGGYEATRVALTQHTPAELIDMVKRSGLRGRGGAGFPAGTKWGFMPTDPAIPKIVAVNTDEGEPGTFKDRALVERDPHQVIEGVIIAAYAVGANRAYVYIRGEFFLGVKRWIKAIADAYRARLSGQRHPRLRLRPGSVGAPGRGRLHLRRRDRDAGVAGGEAAAIRG